jgi:outer membrane protein
MMLKQFVFLCTALTLVGQPAQAESSEWLVKVGAHQVRPDHDNGSLAGGAFKTEVDDSSRPTVTVEYFVNDSFGIELLASTPFRHDLTLNGVAAGSTKHLPPTLSAQYHFNPSGLISPFVGAGINYTLFFQEKTTGPLAGSSVHFKDSVGLALHAGVDYKLSDKWLTSIDMRWIQIDTKASVNGAPVGKVNIDPWVLGAALGYRF